MDNIQWHKSGLYDRKKYFAYDSEKKKLSEIVGVFFDLRVFLFYFLFSYLNYIQVQAVIINTVISHHAHKINQRVVLQLERLCIINVCMYHHKQHHIVKMLQISQHCSLPFVFSRLGLGIWTTMGSRSSSLQYWRPKYPRN